MCLHCFGGQQYSNKQDRFSSCPYDNIYFSGRQAVNTNHLERSAMRKINENKSKKK